MHTPQQIIKTMQSVWCSSIVYIENYTSKKLIHFFQVQKSFLLNSLHRVSPWQLPVSRNYWNYINGTKKTIKYHHELYIQFFNMLSAFTQENSVVKKNRKKKKKKKTKKKREVKIDLPLLMEFNC